MSVTNDQLLRKVYELKIDPSKREDLENLRAAFPEFTNVDVLDIGQAVRLAIEDAARVKAVQGISRSANVGKGESTASPESLAEDEDWELIPRMSHKYT